MKITGNKRVAAAKKASANVHLTSLVRKRDGGIVIRGIAKQFNLRGYGSYFDLVREFPLVVIENDAHLDRASAFIDYLLDFPRRDAGQDAYLNALTTLVESYESEHVDIPDASGLAVLRNLMTDNGVSQAVLSRQTGIAESALSEILSGKRQLSRGNIGKLAVHFGTDPGLFMGDWRETAD
jgi:HTH-type transcriptional regulator/antitoxin HigA